MHPRTYAAHTKMCLYLAFLYLKNHEPKYWKATRQEHFASPVLGGQIMEQTFGRADAISVNKKES